MAACRCISNSTFCSSGLLFQEGGLWVQQGTAFFKILSGTGTGVYRWPVNCNGGEGNDGRLALLGAHDQHLFHTGVFFTDKGTWTQNGDVAIYLTAGISTGKCGKGSG